MNDIQNRLSNQLQYTIDANNTGRYVTSTRLNKKVRVMVNHRSGESPNIKVVLNNTDVFAIQKVESPEDSQYYYNIIIRHDHFHTRSTITHIEACLHAIGLDRFFQLCLRGRRIKLRPTLPVGNLPFLQLGELYDMPSTMRISATRNLEGKLMVASLDYLDLDLDGECLPDVSPSEAPLPAYPIPELNPDYPV